MLRTRQWNFVVGCAIAGSAILASPASAAESAATATATTTTKAPTTPTATTAAGAPASMAHSTTRSVQPAPTAAPAQPAGYIIPVPVRAWSSFGNERTTETTGHLMVPEVLDDKGTFTLIFKADAATQQIALRRSDLADEYHFLFGESDELHLLASRPMDVFPGSVANFAVNIPYDKANPPRLDQKYRLLDAAGEVPEIKVSAQYSSGFSPSLPAIEATPDADGVITVPRVQGLPDLGHLPHYRMPSQVQLDIHHIPTGHRFHATFFERITTQPVTVVLPIAATDARNTSITRVRGKVVNSDGTPAGGISLQFTSYGRIPGTAHNHHNQTTITITTASVRPDGSFDFAFTPDYLVSLGQTQSVQATVAEPIDGLLTYHSHQLEPGTENVIQLPKRLSLTAGLFDRNGEPVFPHDQSKPSGWINLEVQTVDADGTVGQTGHVSIDPKETTSPVFLLKNLPVPGRYTIKLEDVVFGPVDVSETSPAEILRFVEPATLGVRRGLVTDENGEPLAGALVTLSTSDLSDPDVDKLAALLGEVANAEKSLGLEKLTSAVSRIVDYGVTTGSGEYVFPRKVEGQDDSIIYLTALAPGRVSASAYDAKNQRELLPMQSYDLAPVRLPRTITATGIVYPPEQIPDPEKIGALMPMPADRKYRVYWRDTRTWFNQRDDMRWEYDAIRSRHFQFGTPFEYPVPLGTTFTLAALPVDNDIHLSLHIWKEGPAAQEDEPLKLPSATLRALQPFWLQLNYQNGEPAAGLNITSLYGTRSRTKDGQPVQPQTDEQGRILLYGDEGLAPQMYVRGEPGMNFHQQMFKIQPLDMSTSVPTLSLTLDPQIWGTDGRKAR